MTRTALWKASASLAAIALLGAASIHPLGAQGSGGVSYPIGLHIGLPQGEFAENVDLAGGFGGGALVPFGGWFGFRAELGVMLYGSENRGVPLGGGALGLINVDVSTTNSILNAGVGLQAGFPGPRVRPYVGAMIGFSAFATTSSVSGSNSAAEPFASSTNQSDAAFAKSLFAGIYIPVGSGSTVIDLGARYTLNGEEVEYLTPGDITEDAGGNVILSPRRTRADLVTIVFGVTIRPKRQAR